MKIYTKVVLQWKEDGLHKIDEECESFDYDGPVAECGGKSGGTSTVEKSDPWSGIQPYLTSPHSGLYPEAVKLYENHNPEYYQGNTVAGLAPETLQAQQMTRDAATQGSPGNINLQNLYSSTMGGDYLTGGQGFDRAFQAASNRILPQVNSQFALAGRTGSGLAQTAQTQALGDAFAGLYNEERGRQNQMAAMAPMMNQMRYADANTLAGLGAQTEDYQQDILNADIARHNYEQELPYQKLERYAQILNPGLGIGGQRTTTSPVYRNRGAGALGGAATGAMMGSQVMPGWGTAIGALAGGLLGGWG